MINEESENVNREVTSKKKQDNYPKKRLPTVHWEREGSDHTSAHVYWA